MHTVHLYLMERKNSPDLLYSFLNVLCKAMPLFCDESLHVPTSSQSHHRGEDEEH